MQSMHMSHDLYPQMPTQLMQERVSGDYVTECTHYNGYMSQSALIIRGICHRVYSL